MSPQTSNVRIDRLDAGGQYVTERRISGRIDSGLLPGFSVEVGWLWQDPLPCTFACLRELLA